jgi:hypothetical protein
MSTRPIRLLALAAGLASLSLAVPAFAEHQVAPLDVNARAPESIRLDVTGKDVAAVRPIIRTAAAKVCRNAVDNGDISFVDRTWCSQQAASDAMQQFLVIVSHRQIAQADVLVLTAR